MQQKIRIRSELIVRIVQIVVSEIVQNVSQTLNQLSHSLVTLSDTKGTQDTLKYVYCWT